MNNWIKHDGSISSPVPKDTLIEVETWTATGNITAKASELNWAAIKYYREAPNSVERAREELKKDLAPPQKDFAVIFGKQTQHVDGYQAACQRATDLFKNGEEPMIVIRYSKPKDASLICGNYEER